MLTPLSILSLDQGPKWREPATEHPQEETPEVAPGRLLRLVQWIAVGLAAVSRRPGPSRYRA